MKCALEMAIAVQNKLAEEEKERIRKAKEDEIKRQLQIAKEYETYLGYKPTLDNYFEKILLKGNGSAVLLVQKCQRTTDKENMYVIVEKNYNYSKSKPYWWNDILSDPFHLNDYLKSLTDACYDVEVKDASFTAYSSTGASTKRMNCLEIKVSIPETVPCV
jgi:hypothetical protein